MTPRHRPAPLRQPRGIAIGRRAAPPPSSESYRPVGSRVAESCPLRDSEPARSLDARRPPGDLADAGDAAKHRPCSINGACVTPSTPVSVYASDAVRNCSVNLDSGANSKLNNFLSLSRPPFRAACSALDVNLDSAGPEWIDVGSTSRLQRHMRIKLEALAAARATKIENTGLFCLHTHSFNASP